MLFKSHIYYFNDADHFFVFETHTSLENSFFFIKIVFKALLKNLDCTIVPTAWENNFLSLNDSKENLNLIQYTRNNADIQIYQDYPYQRTC